MSVPVITFFNNKGGVGKTSLAYHLAWMFADLGYRVLAADLDPQANLTSSFVDENELEYIWADGSERATVWGALRPFQEGEGNLSRARLTPTSDERLALLAGDLMLATFEDDLSSEWPKCLDGNTRSFRVMAAIWQILHDAADDHGADLVIVDVGPSLGAINRATLVASDHVVIPVAPDLYSLQGLRNLGPTLRKWRSGWQQRLSVRPRALDVLPAGGMQVAGYVVLQHGVRLDRPVKAYQRWMDKIPGEFRSSVLNQAGEAPRVDFDEHCLGQLKHYHSLMQMAQEARKPIFALTTADGAFGGHFQAARDAHKHFRKLAETLLVRIGGLSK